MIPTEYYRVIRREPSLVCYWRLNDPSGSTRALDRAGKYGLNGLYDGSPILDEPLISPTSGEIEELYPGSRLFGAENQNTEIPNSAPLELVSDFTYECWVTTNSSEQSSSIFSKMNSSFTIANPYYIGLLKGIPIVYLGNGTTQITLLPERLRNWVSNPSFEFDTIGNAPAWWKKYESLSPTFNNFSVGNGWSSNGSKAMRITCSLPNLARGGIGTNENEFIPVFPEKNYTLSGIVNILEINGCQFEIDITYFNSKKAELNGGGKLKIAVGIEELSRVLESPSNAAYAKIRCYFKNETGSTKNVDGWIDEINFSIGSKEQKYFDGSFSGYHWNGIPGNSVSESGLEPFTRNGNITHYVVTSFRKLINIYINGNNILSKNLGTQTLSDGGQPVYIGELGNNTSRFQGMVGEVALYESAIGVRKIKEHFSLGRQIIFQKPYYTTYDPPSYS